MKTIRTAARLFVAVCAATLSTSAFAQGGLTPPGGPAPLFKTLDQVKPGTPITNLPFTISTPGVYFLTRSITTTGDGIVINADDVTLDLGGFTLTGDANSSTDHGVDVSAQTNVTIRNGTVRKFGNGLLLQGGTTDALIGDLLLTENTLNGFTAGVTASSNIVTRATLRRVRAVGNATYGIVFSTITGAPLGQNLIDQCEAINSGNTGILVNTPGNLIVRCLATGNGGSGNYSIGVSNRFGIIVLPAVNGGTVSGSSGGVGTGTTDPFANLSF